jgi:hypothetical protein
MPTWSDNLKIELLNVGDTNWGNLTNNNFKWAIEESITGYATATFPSDADYDWAAGYTNSNSSQAQRCLVINVTGSITGTRNFVVPTIDKQYIIQNNTTGGQSIVVKTSAGTGITVPNGRKAHLYVDGTNVIQMDDYDVTRTVGTLSLTNALAVADGGTGITSFGTGVATALGQNVTGSGGIVLNTNPTLSGVTVAGDISITGTGRRITGDFSHGVPSNRIYFQTSAVDSETVVGAIPSGTSKNSRFTVYNSNNPDSSSSVSLYARAADVRISADREGGGSYLPITIYTNGSEQARFDTSGNFLLGVLNAGSTGLSVKNTYNIGWPESVGESIPNIFRQSGTASTIIANGYRYSSLGGGFASSISSSYPKTAISVGSNVSGKIDFFTDSASTVAAGVDVTPSLRVRIDSSGNALFNTTDSSTTSGFGVKILKNSFDPVVSQVNLASTSAVTTWNTYSTGASAFRFYVGLNGTVYATNTSISAISDQRLKENIRNLDVGLAEVLALKPRTFDWKEGKGKDSKNDRGFIAQEFEQVFPDLIDTWKDVVPKGEEPYKSVRQDLIPVLVKAIQEQQAIIEQLKQRIVALEEVR